MNYAKELPLDKNNFPASLIPAKVSNQSQRGVPLASSVLTLSPNTTVVNIMVISGGANGSAGILGKWGVSSVTATNFDLQVNAGQNLSFVVPVSTQGTGTQSVQGINPQLGLFNSLSLITATAQSASVFTAEY